MNFYCIFGEALSRRDAMAKKYLVVLLIRYGNFVHTLDARSLFC